MNITKYEHTIVIGIISAIVGVGIGTNIGEPPKVPVKKEIKVVEVEKPKGLTPAQARKLAYSKLDDYGWSKAEWSCLNWMWGKESAWNYKASSPTKDHGIPQRHMSKDTKAEIHAFQSDPVKQITWGLGYIKHRYGSPCKAKAFWEINRWY